MLKFDYSLKEIIRNYNAVVNFVDIDAQNEHARAYGGIIRSAKGKLQEYITHSLIMIAWKELGGTEDDIEIHSSKFNIPLNSSYLELIAEPIVKNHILQNVNHYYYGLSVDKQVLIRGQFVLGIECKAYTENAMIKRILLDFYLLRTIFNHLHCYLFQLESQLGGDYSDLLEVTYGSKATHTIMSYFNFPLKIVTLLYGERKVDEPIHKFFKPLEESHLLSAIEILKKDLQNYI